jgi:pimeloyl-ACP methyl ester carboxylesterase
MERIVDRGTARLPVSDLGNGLPLALLHAGVADRRSWTELVLALDAASYRTVAYDRRGFGDAFAESADHSHVLDLFAVLDACGVDRAVLIGNSQGGRIAIEAALSNPARVIALVLIETAVSGGPGPEPDEEPAFAALADAIDAAESVGDLDTVNELEARLWLDGPTSAPGRVGGAPRQMFLEMNRTALGAGDVGESEWSDDSWDHLGRINAPTLVVAGELDLPHIRRRSRLIADRVPGALFALQPGCAHLPALEDPKGVAALLTDFLGSISTSR